MRLFTDISELRHAHRYTYNTDSDYDNGGTMVFLRQQELLLEKHLDNTSLMRRMSRAGN